MKTVRPDRSEHYNRASIEVQARDRWVMTCLSRCQGRAPSDGPASHPQADAASPGRARALILSHNLANKEDRALEASQIGNEDRGNRSPSFIGTSDPDRGDLDPTTWGAGLLIV